MIDALLFIKTSHALAMRMAHGRGMAYRGQDKYLMLRYSVITAKNNDLRPGVAAGIIDNPSLSRVPIAEFASEAVAFHVCNLMNNSDLQLPAPKLGNQGRTRVGQ